MTAFNVTGKYEALRQVSDHLVGYLNASGLDDLGYDESKLTPAEVERLTWAIGDVSARLGKLGVVKAKEAASNGA